MFFKKRQQVIVVQQVNKIKCTTLMNVEDYSDTVGRASISNKMFTY